MKLVFLLSLFCAGILLACSSGNEPDGEPLTIPWYLCYTDVVQRGDASQLQTRTFVIGDFFYAAENGLSTSASRAIFPSEVIVNGVDYAGEVDESGSFFISDTTGELLVPIGEDNMWRVVDNGSLVLEESIERSPLVITSLSERNVYSLSDALTIEILGKITAVRPVNITIENWLATGGKNPDAAKFDTVLYTGEPLVLKPGRMAELGFRSGKLHVEATQIVNLARKERRIRRAELWYRVYHWMTFSVEE